MTIKSGIVSPFAHISTSSRWISVVEQRQYLYNQEQQLEKAVRYQEWISESIQNLVKFREKQIHAIMNYQIDQQSDYTGVLQDISWGISDLGFKVDKGTELMSIWLKEINITQLLWLQQLWIIDQTIHNWVDNILESLQRQTTILIRISSQIGKIIETLQNPRKIEGLEYKRDAINYIQKKWFMEALEYLNLASTKLTSDQEVYYFIWIIELEENKNYEVAIENFEKSIKYAKGYGDMQIYSQALTKLANIYFIQDWVNSEKDTSKIQKAFDYQLDAVISSNQNSSYIFDLLKYSVMLSEYDIFAEYLYIFLKNNPYTIADITSYSIFLVDKKVIKIINTVIAKIIEENQAEINALEKEKTEKLEKEKYEKQLWELKDKFYLISRIIDTQEQKEIQWSAIEWKHRSKPELNEYWIGIYQDNSKSIPYKYLVNKFGRIKWPYTNIKLLNNWFAVCNHSSWRWYFLINQAFEIVLHAFSISYCLNWVMSIQENSVSNYLILKDGSTIRVPSWFSDNSFITTFDYRKWYALLIECWPNYRYNLYQIFRDWTTKFIARQNENEITHIRSFFENSVAFNLDENKYYITDYHDSYVSLHDKRTWIELIPKWDRRNIEKYLIQQGDLVSNEMKISYNPEYSSFWNKLNFIGPDGEYTLKSSNIKWLLDLYKERDSFIEKYLITIFDENGLWAIRFLNEIYRITRNKNKFWGFDYKILF